MVDRWRRDGQRQKEGKAKGRGELGFRELWQEISDGRVCRKKRNGEEEKMEAIIYSNSFIYLFSYT
jgi:hypothetical protein